MLAILLLGSNLFCLHGFCSPTTRWWKTSAIVLNSARQQKTWEIAKLANIWIGPLRDTERKIWDERMWG
jgi:hypothetical protein